MQAGGGGLLRLLRALPRLASLLSVGLDKERDEQVGERGEVEAVGEGGKDLARIAEAGGFLVELDEQVQRGEGAADDELRDLQCGERLLQQRRHPDVKPRQCVVRVHQCVDQAVEDAEDPDRGCHVAARKELAQDHDSCARNGGEHTGYQPTCRS